MANTSAPSIVKAFDGSPVGALADFSLDSSAIAADPRDTSAQIPTFSATVTDLAVPVNTLIDDAVTFHDWAGSDTTAKVKSVKRSGNSGLTQIDTSTLFDRLNTEQTTFPVMLYEEETSGGTWGALYHWCLMAGVPQYSTPGNLLQAIPRPSADVVGYLADSPSALRSNISYTDGYTGFCPTIGTDLPVIEVNPSQSMMLGALFGASTQLASFRILTNLPAIQKAVTYTVQRIDNTFVVLEQVGSAAPTTLLTANYTPVSPAWFLSANLLVQANVANPTKVDLTLRVIEWGGAVVPNTQDVVTDFTATAVTSTLTQRPVPYQIEMGWDQSLVGSRDSLGDIAEYYMAEGSVLPTKFPKQQVNVLTPYGDAGFDANDPHKVPGFTANVWEKIKEFCSITEMDVLFSQDSLQFSPRSDQLVDGFGNALAPSLLSKANLTTSVENREVSQYVDVKYSDTVSNDYWDGTELWRADSVYSLNKGEYKEEIIQTHSTFIRLDQPLAVTGVPVPYDSGFGSYVVTGNDGYIVDPQWWEDNGGSIQVEQTGTAGEIKIKMQAPQVDTVRAPYRISEGAADRPALYLFGSGLNLGESKTLRIATGAGDAAQESITFDSPFVTNLGLAYNVGYKVADSMGGAGGDISFDVGKSTLAMKADASTTGLEYNSVPQGSLVYQDGATYRITALSLKPNGLTVSRADQFTTVATVNDGLGPNATIDQWNTLHANKTVKEVNLAPLPLYLT